MKTQLCQKLVALFLISIFVSGCNTGTKKTADNDIKFDSISVDKTYHLLENSGKIQTATLQINFTFPGSNTTIKTY